MSLRVLQSRAQNASAREEMQRDGISYWPNRLPRRVLDRLLFRRPTPVGDAYKSWDVLQTVRLLQQRLNPDASVIDLGAYASEILCSLHLLGFNRLTGIDLNPAIRMMPFADRIRWSRGDMMATGLPDGSFAAVTAISAIEHGVDLRALFRETSRLLEPGGLFVASTDYWPDKIDTRGIRMYGLEWTIFSRDEITAVIELARGYGLEPLGDLQFDSAERAVEAGGRRYTFAWLALQKRL